MSTQPQETARRASESVLCQLLSQVADLLSADPSFAEPGVEVLTEDKGDIDTEIAARLSSLGICVLVMLSDARGAKESMPGPVFDHVGLIVEISENALTNRSNGGRTCLEKAEQAARMLHHGKLASGRTLVVTDIAKWPSPPEPADVCYHIPCKVSNVSLNRKVTST